MHADQSALLLTIADYPDDDTPRLIYADWLEENGDSDRAEFIRVQIRKAQLAPSDPAFIPLMQREMALSMQHETKWRAALPQLPGLEWGPCQRGFITRLTIRDAVGMVSLSQHLPELIGHTPWMELYLHADFQQPDYGLLQSLPPIPCLRTVHIDMGYRDPSIYPLFDSAILQTVRRFECKSTGTANVLWVTALHNSRHLSQLQVIELQGFNANLASLGRLTHERLPSLHTLICQVTRNAELGIHLRDSNILAQLRWLDLSNTELSDDSGSALAMTPMPQLEVLRLNQNRLTDASMDDMAGTLNWPRLHRLELQQHHLTALGIRRLLDARWAANLTYLDLGITAMSDATIAPLLEATHLTKLEVLKLGRTDLSDESASRLAANPHFPALRQVDLGRTRISSVGVKCLQMSPRLSQVQWQWYGLQWQWYKLPPKP